MSNSQTTDNELSLKIRARRRLLGAVAFAGLAAVVLPMVMDEAPKQQVQDIQIRIPGQNQTAFMPKIDRQAKAPETVESAAGPDAGKAAAEKTTEKATEEVAEKPVVSKSPEKVAEQGASRQEKEKQEKVRQERLAKVEKQAEKPAENTAKPAEKKPEAKPEAKPESKPGKTADKPAEKPAEKSLAKAQETKRTRAEEAQRAADALAGKDVDAVGKEKEKARPATAAEGDKSKGGGQYVILIGAFSNAANVKQLQGKLSGQGIRAITEPIEAGKKTRVRAGPFASREAAEKALEKMKQVGVNGVISGKP